MSLSTKRNKLVIIRVTITITPSTLLIEDKTLQTCTFSNTCQLSKWYKCPNPTAKISGTNPKKLRPINSLKIKVLGLPFRLYTYIHTYTNTLSSSSPKRVLTLTLEVPRVPDSHPELFCRTLSNNYTAPRPIKKEEDEKWRLERYHLALEGGATYSSCLVVAESHGLSTPKSISSTWETSVFKSSKLT